MKAAIFGPEKEPDARKDEACGYQGKQCEDTAVVDIVRVKGTATWRIRANWGCGIAGSKVGVFLERGEGRCSFRRVGVGKGG